MTRSLTRPLLAPLVATVLLLQGCGHTYRFDAAAVAEGLRLRTSVLSLEAPEATAPASESAAATGSAPGKVDPPLGLDLREARTGKSVRLPPRGKLVLDTRSSSFETTPSRLALDGDTLVAGAERVALADLREARFHRPGRVPIIVGVIAVTLAFFGVVLLTVYVNRL